MFGVYNDVVVEQAVAVSSSLARCFQCQSSFFRTRLLSIRLTNTLINFRGGNNSNFPYTLLLLGLTVIRAFFFFFFCFFIFCFLFPLSFRQDRGRIFAMVQNNKRRKNPLLQAYLFNACSSLTTSHSKTVQDNALALFSAEASSVYSGISSTEKLWSSFTFFYYIIIQAVLRFQNFVYCAYQICLQKMALNFPDKYGQSEIYI